MVKPVSRKPSIRQKAYARARESIRREKASKRDRLKNSRKYAFKELFSVFGKKYFSRKTAPGSQEKFNGAIRKLVKDERTQMDFMADFEELRAKRQELMEKAAQKKGALVTPKEMMEQQSLIREEIELIERLRSHFTNPLPLMQELLEKKELDAFRERMRDERNRKHSEFLKYTRLSRAARGILVPKQTKRRAKAINRKRKN